MQGAWVTLWKQPQPSLSSLGWDSGSRQSVPAVSLQPSWHHKDTDAEKNREAKGMGMLDGHVRVLQHGRGRVLTVDPSPTQRG